MNATFTNVNDYQPTPRTTDPDEIIAEKNLAIGWLLGELDKAEAVVADRENQISVLYAELAGLA